MRTLKKALETNIPTYFPNDAPPSNAQRAKLKTQALSDYKEIVTVDNVITYIDRNNIKSFLATNDLLKDIAPLEYNPCRCVMLVNHEAVLVNSDFAPYFDPTTLKDYLHQGYVGRMFGIAIYTKRNFVLDYDFKLYELPFEFSTDRQNNRNPIYDVL